MLLLHCVKRMKEGRDYKDVPFEELMDALRAGFDTIAELLIEQGEDAVFQIPRFGVFILKKHKGHVARNPKDGSRIRVPDRMRIKFRTSPALMRKLNRDMAAKYKRNVRRI